jgi:hypothetical protein
VPVVALGGGTTVQPSSANAAVEPMSAATRAQRRAAGRVLDTRPPVWRK